MVSRWRAGLIVLTVGLGLCLSVPRVLTESPSASSSSSDAATVGFINQSLATQWKENKLTPSATASDYEFLRRAYLDIIGRVPSVEEIKAFRKRSPSTRRAEEIDHLLKHEDYARNWANLWTVWLLTRHSARGIDREATRKWLEESFRYGKPYDKMVEEILTASGKSNENGAANFVLSHVGEKVPAEHRSRDGMYEMVPVTSRTTRLFLGIQTQCTQCHNHPYVKERQQQQYWGINVFFRQVERDEVPERPGRDEDEPQFMALRDNLEANQEGGVFFEQAKNGLLQRTALVYLDGTKVSLSTTANRRQELAKLLIKDEYFSKAFVNRMWHHFFGRGFTNPMDDFGEHNPLPNPDLLDRLAKDFVASGHDPRRLIRWICNSNAYQLTSISNKTNEKQDAEPFFSRMLLKSLTPEQLVDSILVATNVENTMPDSSERRKLYREWMKDFTVKFGDDEGNEMTFNGTVVQALMLMNGKKLNEALHFKKGSTLYKALSKSSAAQQLDQLYLAALCRPPSAAERTEAIRILSRPAKDPTGPWQDVLWALLNSNEFILNH